MNKMLLSAALAGIVTAGFAVTAQAADAPAKEKCFGIAKAGKNDCKSFPSHSSMNQKVFANTIFMLPSFLGD